MCTYKGPADSYIVVEIKFANGQITLKQTQLIQIIIELLKIQ